MTRFDSGFRPDRGRRRNSAPDRRVADRLPIDTQTTSASLDIVQPIPAENDATVALLAAVGLAETAANVAGQLSARQQRIKAQQERDDAEMERTLRGHGAQRSAELAPQLAQDIADGKYAAHVGDDEFDVESYAATIVGQYADPNDTGPLTDELRNRLTPRVIEGLVKYDAKEREVARVETMQAITDGLSGVTDDAAFEKALTEAESAGIDPELARDEIGLSAYAFAAETGNAQARDAARRFLGDSQSLKQAKLDVRFEESVRRIETANRQQAEDEIASLELANRDPASGIGFDGVREAITNRRAALGDERTLAMLNRVDAQEAEYEKDTLKQMVEVQRESIETGILDAATDLTRHARTTGGAALIEDQRYTTADGKEHTLTRNQILERVVPLELQRIAAESPDEQTALVRQSEYLALNNVQNPQWSRVLGAGFSAGAAAFIDDENGTETPLPSATVAGYDLYKRLSAVNPQVVKSHMPSDEAAVFYARAEIAERYLDPGNPEGALLRATTTQRTNISASLPPTEIDRETRWANFSGNLNVGEVRAKVGQVARMLMQSPGLESSDAIREASRLIKNSHTQIGRQWVYTGNRNVPENIDSLSSSAAKRYLQTYPGEDGLRERDLALMPSAVPGLWVLHDTRGAAPTPVDHWRAPMIGRFDDAELGTLNRVLAVNPKAEIRYYSPGEAQAMQGDAENRKRLAARRNQAMNQVLDQQRRESAVTLRQIEEVFGLVPSTSNNDALGFPEQPIERIDIPN